MPRMRSFCLRTRGREVKFEVWSYTESDGFPQRHPSFFRRHWKAIPAACAVLFLCIAAVASIAAGTANQPIFTSDSPYVYDGAHVLDSSVVGTLTELNETLESRSEGAQLYIVTIDSLPLGKTIEQYSIEQAERIGAGNSKKDNGVLYTFVKSTRQDRLEVGYGLEDRLTDSACSKILEAVHAYYRRGDIGAGVKNLARDVADKIQPGIGSPFDSALIDKFPEKSTMDKFAEGAVCLVAFVLIVAWAYYRGAVFPSRKNRSYSSSSRSPTSSSRHSSGSSHRSGGGHFGGGGASGGW